MHNLGGQMYLVQDYGMSLFLVGIRLQKQFIKKETVLLQIGGLKYHLLLQKIMVYGLETQQQINRLQFNL